MIGRLVEKEDIGVGRQHARKRRTARLAAGECRRIFLPGEAELLEQIDERRGGSSLWPQAGLHIGKRSRES